MNDTDQARSRDLPSGRFVLRIDPTLHATLRKAASRTGLSLNEYCARTLAGGGLGVAGPGWHAVERAAAVVAEDLVGVVVYDSWARGDTADGSDVDVLVVVASCRPISRALYRRWDQEPVVWPESGSGPDEALRVESHFVHLPSPGDPPSGTWAEVALDGIVLFDPDLTVSRRLVELRASIVDGAVVCESQEIVELAIKALLRRVGVDPPRIHDVSDVLEAERRRLPGPIADELEVLTGASRDLRRDRELAFCGADDLTPSGFYSRNDGERARSSARRVVEIVMSHVS